MQLAAPHSQAGPWLTPEQAACALGLCRPTVVALMKAHRLKHIEIGTAGRSHRRTTREWIEVFKEEQQGQQEVGEIVLPPTGHDASEGR